MDVSDLRDTFRSAAVDAVQHLVRSDQPFSTDDVWHRIGPPKSWGVEPRALGGIFVALAARGVIERTGEERQSVRRECHGRPVKLWRRPSTAPDDSTSAPPSAESGFPSLMNPRWLYARYVLDGMPTMVLAKETESSRDDTATALHEAGIPIRRGAEDVLTVPVLARLYIERGCEPHAIGAATGTGPGAVEVMLNRFGIPASDRGRGPAAAAVWVNRWRAEQTAAIPPPVDDAEPIPA